MLHLDIRRRVFIRPFDSTAIYPDRAQAGLARTVHIVEGVIANMQRLLRAGSASLSCRVEYRSLGFRRTRHRRIYVCV